jgi:hypothetical protein
LQYLFHLAKELFRSDRPVEVFELLDLVREFTNSRLPKLIGSTQVTVCEGEQWSPRKLLRRAIWHERVHTLQIGRYLSVPQSGFESKWAISADLLHDIVVTQA